MKQVTVIQTGNPSPQVISTDANNWEELTTDLAKAQIQFSADKMKAIIGETRHTLESPNAILPATNFSLFLLVKKSKAGNNTAEMSYRECRIAIKNVIAESSDKDMAKKFFSNGSKNYTQTSTDYMRTRLAAWIKKFNKAESVSTKKAVEEAVEEVIEEVIEEKVNEIAEDYAVSEAIDIINFVRADLKRKKKLFPKLRNISLDDLYTLKIISKLVNSMDAVDTVVPSLAELKNEFNDVS